MKKLVTLCVFILFTFFSQSRAQNCNWQVTVQVTNPSCPGTKDGSAEVYINGSPAGLNQADYLWSTGWDMPSVNKLRAGNYTVSVHDQNNHCIDIISFTVVDPVFPVVQLQVMPAQCGSEGSVTFEVPSTQDWYIKWIDGEIGEPEETKYDFSYSRNLPAGTYGYYIVVGYCNQYNEVVIPQAAPIQIVPSWGDPNNTTLGTSVNILVAVSGGFAPYTYEWYELSNPHKVVTTDDELNASVAGTYYLKITDAMGCRKTSEMIHILNSPNPAPIQNTNNVFPNPTRDRINVSIEKGNNRISLIDMNGRVLKIVEQKAYGSNYLPLDLGNYSSGIYTLNIQNKDQNTYSSEKIVLKN